MSSRHDARRADPRPIVAALALLLVATIHRPARATNGASPITWNAKAAGRGGAGGAVADGATSGILNPATLLDVEVPSVALDGNLLLIYARTRFVNDRSDESVQGIGTPAPSLGVSWDPFGPTTDEQRARRLGSDVRVGLLVYVPAGGSGASTLKTKIFPGGETESTSFLCVNIAPVVSFRIFDRLSIGIAPALSYGSIASDGLVGGTGKSGGPVFQYRDSQGNPLPSPQPKIVNGKQVTYGELFDITGRTEGDASTRAKLNGATGIGYGGTIGLLWDPLENLSLSLSYRIEGVIPRLQGTAKVDATAAFNAVNADPGFAAIAGAVLNAYLPDGGQNGYTNDYNVEIRNFRIPALATFGVGFRPTDELLLALDLRYLAWRHAFDVTPYTLSGGTNNDINAVNGGTRVERQSVQHWRDQFIIAVGGAYRINDQWSVRLGYNFGSNPIPDETLTPTSGIIEHHMTLGASFYLGRFDLDMAYIYGIQAGATIQNSPRAPQWNGTSFKTEQHMLYIGAKIAF